ncbi:MULTISPECIES: gamma-glutamyltransferase [unclassified Neisseria]|uniref:gamma-glutamyltransferase n=1 Tax=unclassified Neisseria TaxID=2623750 RepID=UPI00266640E3|nr:MULTISPECIES: gamma-glutamyltransferase [unclassified Neisseria]MDO1509657.1 gamma-glutamyltransferase [Neisseria sp. MVDL19-042950]MDO1516019.1 gamma-glutamyltransferase [Neisseria sp. MVDL18-041461]MDO1563132.1 gamma-glutamyltransferase [Neisseria sp. MVDL20-010259]
MKTLYSLLATLTLAAYAQTASANPLPLDRPQAVPAAAAVENHAPEQGTGITEQKLVQAKEFMAASANPLATEAGYEILKRGGSAIDAMIAMQTTLSLTEPQSSGLGGGAFLVYWDNKEKKLTTFDARETAPKAAEPELFLDKNGKPLEFIQAVVGGRSVGVPGVPKLLEDVHKRYGRLPWHTLFDKPIELAQKGFPVSARMARSIEQNREQLQRHSATAAYFMPEGKPLEEGTLLKNPEFAATVKLLAKQGSGPFYKGIPAFNIVKTVIGMSDNPGRISIEDFKNYQVIERAPVCTPYREYEICGMGAPSSGGIALGQIFGILQHFNMRALGADNIMSWRLLGDASRLAFADRNYYIADPEFADVPVSAMLHPAYLKLRAELIADHYGALKDVMPGGFARTQAKGKAIELPSTSHLVIVDKEGNVVSMTTSIENAFGSTLMANGYLLNNELTDFSFKPVDEEGKPVANSVAGGKRPRSSMAPTIVLKNGEPYLAVGSPGGSRIIGYVAKTLTAHLDWGMDIQQAIDLPNMLNRTGTYELEQNTPAADKASVLERLGYKVQVRDLNSGIQGIVIRADGLQGGADPRREGKVMGD